MCVRPQACGVLRLKQSLQCIPLQVTLRCLPLAARFGWHLQMLERRSQSLAADTAAARLSCTAESKCAPALLGEPAMLDPCASHVDAPRGWAHSAVPPARCIVRAWPAEQGLSLLSWFKSGTTRRCGMNVSCLSEHRRRCQLRWLCAHKCSKHRYRTGVRLDCCAHLRAIACYVLLAQRLLLSTLPRASENLRWRLL